jgi:hypothetical protein
VDVIDKNVCDTLDDNEDLFCEDDLVAILKGLKNKKNVIAT